MRPVATPPSSRAQEHHGGHAQARSRPRLGRSALAAGGAAALLRLAKSQPAARLSDRKRAGGKDGAAQHVLGIDDAIRPSGGVDGQRVGGQHRIAEQYENQRGRDDHPQRARNRDRRLTQRRRQTGGTQARLDGAPERQNAGADRPAHGTEQRAQSQACHHRGARAVRQQPEQRAKHGRRHAHAVEQHAHQDIERQSLQQIALQQIDEATGQGAEQDERDAAAQRPRSPLPTRPRI